MTECVTWNCTRPGIAHLVIRRPCGHAVALNSSGLGPRVRDGSRPDYVQRQWSCGPCIRERAGTRAPGPSTCPVCGVREPIIVNPVTHATTADASGEALCGVRNHGGLVAFLVRANRRITTCPDCLEWLHS